MSKVEHSTDSNCKWNEQAKMFFFFCKNTEEHYIYTLKSWRPTQLATIASSSSPGEKEMELESQHSMIFRPAFVGDRKRTCGVDGYSRWRWKLGRIFRLDTWTYTTQRFFFGFVFFLCFFFGFVWVCFFFLIFFWFFGLDFYLILSDSIPTMRKRSFVQQLLSTSSQPFHLFASILPFHPTK